MHFTAQQIATLVQGRLEGDPDIKVSSVAKIEEAKEGDLCFLSNPKYEEFIYSSAASVVLLNESLELSRPVSATLIRVKDAYSSFAFLLEQYNNMISGNGNTGIEQPSFISSSASLGKDVYIGAFSYIGDNVRLGDGVKIYPGSYVGNNVVIGAGSRIYPGVKVYHGCLLGEKVVIHSGSVIGGDGFGFAPLSDGTYKKIAQIGNVIIEDDVEIGANCAIDRATLGSTILRKGVKFDNFIHIAHNVEVGENCYFAAHTVVAGSTKIGKNCMTSGQVGIVGHLQIADGTIVTAQSGISKSITKSGEVLMGSPAFDANKYRKSFVHFRNLDAMAQRITALEKQLKEKNDGQ
jgi:UDP-3-O-[3-hydroxymyristoyl] glucosamine N-acyltransferase